MSRVFKKAGLILSIAYFFVTLPIILSIAVNIHLKNTLQETWSHWLCKGLNAKAIFCGDSIMAGGGHWSAPGEIFPASFLTRNLAGNAYTTRQIVAQLETGLRDYHPDKVYVFCGVNDAFSIFEERLTPAQSKEDFQRLLSMAPNRTIVTLPTPVRNPEVNQILKQLREVYRKVAESMNVTVVDLTPRISGGDGLIAEDLTNDGVHLNSSVYRMWREELQKAAQKK